MDEDILNPSQAHAVPGFTNTKGYITISSTDELMGTVIGYSVSGNWDRRGGDDDRRFHSTTRGCANSTRPRKRAAIQRGHRVVYPEAHVLLEDSRRLDFRKANAHSNDVESTRGRLWKHYLADRFHQGIGGQLIKKQAGPANDNGTNGTIVSRSRLGGGLNYCHREAA